MDTALSPAEDCQLVCNTPVLALSTPSISQYYALRYGIQDQLNSNMPHTANGCAGRCRLICTGLLFRLAALPSVPAIAPANAAPCSSCGSTALAAGRLSMGLTRDVPLDGYASQLLLYC